jgi:hypothetical protein
MLLFHRLEMRAYQGVTHIVPVFDGQLCWLSEMLAAANGGFTIRL